MIPDLDALARSLTSGAAPFAFCGIGVWRPGETVFYTETADGIVADEDSLFRVASVSKIVTAAAFEGAACLNGFERPYDVEAGPILGLDLRHPLFPQTPVTLGMLMTHTSGLSDAAGYSFEGALGDAWDPKSVFGAHEPGTYFSYCNLGYILLAAAAEIISGERFDVLVSEALSHNGFVSGFNWAGLDDATCARAVPTYRRQGADFVAMIDADPLARFQPTDSYVLGQHTWQFSPQGGLRMSLRDMLGLSMMGAGTPRAPLWRTSDGPGDYLDGLFQDYGAGEQILPNPTFYPRPLVGHFGNAYGFNGGTWWDAQANMCFAYVLNGVPMGDESDALSEAEQQIFAAIAALQAP